ncbi:MAG: 2-oxo-4-hydroxy-4-carboxy-5-ureidoimidazoline decarboxylase [Burkholderiales bacterium]|nr:MAG: 2-oxo-4-hydroxy-4-carboxy-5-ureidoimidazoline decarboxylase [Betaproteobacteria bacterium]TAG83674.1 MAG: 2-oxo-4-hydroxy-4-carboxy-5-ureidoimidazoline decarboxylase [Burkholderiales bacterium]
MPTLADINQLNAAQFSQLFGAVYEHSPWIAERAFALKPAGGFTSRAQVHAALAATVQSASEAEKVALLNVHPELAGKEAAAGTLTSASTSEQASAGLTAMTAADVTQLRELNTAYREKFGFPFIIAVRNNTQTAIFGAVKSRLANTRAMELNNCMMQVGEIARLRLMDLIED